MKANCDGRFALASCDDSTVMTSYDGRIVVSRVLIDSILSPIPLEIFLFELLDFQQILHSTLWPRWIDSILSPLEIFRCLERMFCF